MPEITDELVEVFRQIVSEHHGYIPTDFAADCLVAVLNAAGQGALDTEAKPTGGAS